jgi:sugar phosphate isomerase/epimerase
MQSSQLAAAALASSWLSRRTFANPLGRSIGIQLYTVKESMQEDPAGTLKKLREIGFGEVETAGFGKVSARQFRRLLDDTGLACPSAHLSFDVDHLGSAFDDAHALGAKFAASGSLDSLVPGPMPAVTTTKRAMSLDQAKRTAELANRIGEAAKRAGLQYVYHNHDFEFVDQGSGAIGYDVLLRETDPALVKFEIDCGWMVFAGHNPIDYFNKFPNRFPLIHVKDFLPAGGKTTAAGDLSRPSSASEALGLLPGEEAAMRGAELGHGVVDYHPIFAAAKKAGLQHYFVEQEGPFARMSPMQAARVDYDYLHAIG